jgi:hypothetical protein
MSQEASLPFKVLVLQLGSVVRLKSIKEFINHLGPLAPLSLTDGLRDPLWSDLENGTSPGAWCLRRGTSLARCILDAQVLKA